MIPPIRQEVVWMGVDGVGGREEGRKGGSVGRRGVDVVALPLGV